MLKKTLKFVALCLFFVLSSQMAMAQFGQMRGTVINEDGTPFAGAEIYIDREDIRGHYELKADNNGRFFHAGLPLGRYSVSVMMTQWRKIFHRQHPDTDARTRNGGNQSSARKDAGRGSRRWCAS